MTKIKILGIVPYEAMKTAMERVAVHWPQAELDVYVGDLKKGVEISLHNFQDDYDVIISRGGTAEMIMKATHIPVIEIQISIYDILQAMKLAEHYSEKYAIVGFASITGSARLLCDLLQYKINIVTIKDENEVEATLRELKKNGCQMILCDTIGNTIAKRIGLNSILITSGQTSIEDALERAIKLCTSYVDIKAENTLLKEVIRNEDCQTIIFDERQNVYLSTWMEEDPDFLRTLRQEIPETLNGNNHKAFHNVNGILYSVRSQVVFKQDRPYVVFYISSAKVPVTTGKYGIHFSSKKDAEQYLYNSFYSIIHSRGELQAAIEQISQTHFPVMITGEAGTGKEQAARSIYCQSDYCRNPMITINCRLLNDKSWGFLTNHYNSPFNDDHNTIFFKNIDMLSADRRRQLLSIILDTNMAKRNRLLFSCISPSQNTLPPAGKEISNYLACLTVWMKPLRELVDEIPTLSSLYLGNLNMELAKQTIGFESQAMELLQQYGWPGNYTQFKRVLNELSVTASAPYIQASAVRKVLEKEADASSIPAAEPVLQQAPLDLDKRLSDIIADVIRLTLEKNKGNQSSAARQLGISRTTLWRYMHAQPSADS